MMVQYLLISSVNAIKSLPTMSVNRAAVKKLYHLKVLIYYDGIQRIEQFMFPQEAFREILLNVVVTRIIAPAILSRLAYMRIKYISGMMERCRLDWIQRRNCLKSILSNHIIPSWQIFSLKVVLLTRL